MHSLSKDLVVSLVIEDIERIEFIRVIDLLDVTSVGDEVPERHQMLVFL